MKILVLILLFVNTAAMLTPCCAFDGCDDNINASSHSKKEAKGACSPFSTCTSCSGAVMIAKTITAPNPPVLISGFAEAGTCFILPSFTTSFWQPPRWS